ncbi:MAG: tetratricopeptide repeat protein [Myxococcaceae bacterium]|nr:tetratricopeptide repeat protein [Myxococcaceae bacterium]
MLLNPESASGEYVLTDPSIVRALISPPARTQSREIPAIPQRSASDDDEVTVPFLVPLDEATVPYLIAGMALALHPLHPFVAYVASFIDGKHTVAALSRSARVPEIEIKAVLKSLCDQGLVELHRQPAPPVPEDELPLVQGAILLEEGSSSTSEEEVPPLSAPPAAPARAEPPPPRVLFSTPPPTSRPATAPLARAPLPAPPVARAPAEPPAPASPPSARMPFSSSPPRPRTVTPAIPMERLQEPGSPQPSERAEDILQRAVRFEREGQVDRAIELLKRGLVRSSGPAPLYNKLALILVSQRKDFAQASELLERAVELEPANPVFQQNLLKVVSMAATAPESRKKPRGLLDRLTGRDG